MTQKYIEHTYYFSFLNGILFLAKCNFIILFSYLFKDILRKHPNAGKKPNVEVLQQVNGALHSVTQRRKSSVLLGVILVQEAVAA